MSPTWLIIANYAVSCRSQSSSLRWVENTSERSLVANTFCTSVLRGIIRIIRWRELLQLINNSLDFLARAINSQSIVESEYRRAYLEEFSGNSDCLRFVMSGSFRQLFRIFPFFVTLISLLALLVSHSSSERFAQKLSSLLCRAEISIRPTPLN